MKYPLIGAILALGLLVAVTGCAETGMARTLDSAEHRVEEKLEVAEETLEKILQTTAAPTETTEEILLTPEEAEKIALDHLGFAADQVQRLKTEFEFDDGVPQYDVQFHDGPWEYEFEIHAQTGKILSFDKDRDD